MSCSHSHLFMAKKQKRMAAQQERKDENVSCWQTLAHGRIFLTYSIMTDGNDYDDGKKGEIFLQ